jgi:hypothetical protein
MYYILNIKFLKILKYYVVVSILLCFERSLGGGRQCAFLFPYTIPKRRRNVGSPQLRWRYQHTVQEDGKTTHGLIHEEDYDKS